MIFKVTDAFINSFGQLLPCHFCTISLVYFYPLSLWTHNVLLNFMYFHRFIFVYTNLSVCYKSNDLRDNLIFYELAWEGAERGRFGIGPQKHCIWHCIFCQPPVCWQKIRLVYVVLTRQQKSRRKLYTVCSPTVVHSETKSSPQWQITDRYSLLLSEPSLV